MDSTILSSETLDDLAILIGKIEQIKNITKDAMDGKINFIGSLEERVRVLKDTNENHLVQIKNNLQYNPGAKELISTMKKNGSICALCTGGFYFIANEVKATLGFNYVQANTLEIKDVVITGNLIKPIFNEDSKKEFLKHLADKYKLSLENTCSIGDGANDIKMNQLSSLGVSFRGNKILKDHYYYYSILLLLLNSIWDKNVDYGLVESNRKHVWFMWQFKVPLVYHMYPSICCQLCIR